MSETNKKNKKTGLIPTRLLVAIKKDITININIADKKYPIKIPPPKWGDKRWVKKINKLQWQARQEALSNAIGSNNVWRVAYLLSKNEEDLRKGITKDLLNLDGLINLSDYSGTWGLVAKALDSNFTDIAKLLIASGADVERIPAGQQNKRAMTIAIDDDNIEMVEILYIAGAEINKENLTKAPSSKMKKFLKSMITDGKEKDTIINPPKNTTNPLADENILWEKVDNDTISKTVETSKSRLQTIFNFKASRIMHVYENLDTKTGQVIHRHSPIIEYFNKVQNASEIEEAYDRLVSLGGNPNPKFKDKNYKTIRKINTNNKPS